MDIETSPNNSPAAPPVINHDFDHSESYAELFPSMVGRSRLYLHSRGKLVKHWRGQILKGEEIAIALHTTQATDHHAPAVTSAAASNGRCVVTIMASELPRFLQAHREHSLIVANGGKTFWILMQACEQAGIDTEFLWRKIAWRHFTDVTLLDMLLRLPRPFGELQVPRTLYDIAAELVGVHILPATPRDQLMKIMHWRTARAKYDLAGFLAGAAHGLFLCAQLLRILPILSQPPLFASAQEHLIPEHWFEILQRLLLRASIARQKIFMNGLSVFPVACMDHKAGLVLAAGEMMMDINKQRPTWHLFGDDDSEGQLATSVRLDGDKLLKVLAGVRRKYPDLPELPDLSSADYLHPVLLSAYSEVEPVLRAVALFQMDLRLNADMLIGEDGRLRLRYVNLPTTRDLVDVFSYLLQSGYASRLLRTSRDHGLLLICCDPGPLMDPDLLAALVLSSAVEVIRRGYRVVAHFEGSLILEASGEQLTEESQRVLEKIIADHIGLHLQRPELAEVACRRMCGFESVEDILLTQEARQRLGRPA